MRKNYIRTFDTVEDMLEIYTTLSGTGEVIGFDADVYDNDADELVENKHFTKQNFNYYVMEQSMSGETPMIKFNKVSPSEFEDGTVVAIFSDGTDYTFIDTKTGAIVNDIVAKGEVVDATISGYEEVNLSETMLLPIFSIDGSDYHFDENINLYTDGNKAFDVETLAGIGLIILFSSSEDLQKSFKDSYEIGNISNEEMIVDEKYILLL